jgi:hypothetical protein
VTQESPVSPKAAIHDTEVRMITIGVDAHKRLHVAVALDAAGRQLGVWKGANSSRAWQELKDWAADFGGQRVWGVEGAWSYGRGLAQHLVVSGEVVCEVNSRWTALGRRSARKRGKTDRLDARSVAAFVRQEVATLPRVGEDDETAVLDLLVRERENAMAEVTRLRNQIHALLMQIDSEYEIRLRNRRVRTRMRLLESYEPPVAASTPLQRERVAAVRRLATRARVAFEHAEGLAKRIRALAPGGVRTTDRAGRCRSADGWPAGRHPRPRPTLRGRVPARCLRRRRAARGVVRRTRPPPSQPRRSSAAQLDSLPHRPHSEPALGTSARLPCAPTSRRQDNA